MNFNLGVSQRIKLQFGPQWGILAQEHVDSLKTSQSIFKNGDLSLAAKHYVPLPFIHFGCRFEQGLTNVKISMIGINGQARRSKYLRGSHSKIC
jgi:hypothetical protein